jgi:fibulin 1/2
MCQSGYVYNSETSKCKDINECAINIHKCATGMRCENIPGSYRCIREIPCGTGYVVESLTQECIGKWKNYFFDTNLFFNTFN